ncbi:uncharacterized protein B0H18DRAFT_907544 [Fomitopsis serialis]|uniref:uncharacterized protein n=1 Tax=Fomitopsis serialis TaxID=139415 RepID=UPI002007D106|nr:uncharacterized protein B0H18DRAFT_907544 [Neoantrodia serialis]KAH9927287.1 hypothetical protein B0H18DRAFT_907544 [Neoantrodia serialis]
MALLHRPPTPDSPMSSSFQRVTHNIDDLTLALTNFSRGSSPEPPDIAICCCGKEDCQTSKSWLAWKAKMESRLVLSAEVGQALLERHEAFLRRRESSASVAPSAQLTETISGEEQVDARVADLVRQNAVLEKRLTQALVNSEVLESSNKAAVQELQEARSNVSRLTAQNARSVGWENRLAVALQEKDDMQQERDSATQRARLAESRISTLKEKCAKLQAQVTRLREDLEMQRNHRQQMSEDVLADARRRLEQLQQSQLGHAVKTDDTEVMKVLESLVADNEALKRDNAELQNLLTEAREDLHTLQEEMEERRAGDASYLRHRYTSSGQSDLPDPISPLSATFHVGTAPSGSMLHTWHRQGNLGRRPVSVERLSRRGFEPLTPETERRPLSPTDSLIPSETKWTSFARHRYTPSHHSYEDDESHVGLPMSPERTRAQKSLLLLTRSRGVQTDGSPAGSLAPSPIPPTYGDRTSAQSSHDGLSESSSLTDGQSGPLGILMERVTMLLNRLTQADALTLTNRLKRQRLLGADVSHLSRTTVSSILHEATTLRSHFRAFLEDEKAMMTCSRRDLRALFKLFKDMFSEMGQMRVTLNDVILDPSVAVKVSEMALNPSKATVAQNPGGGETSNNQASSGWMAPISKLLGLPGGNANPSETAASRALSPPARGRAPSRVPSRIVPKREAVLSASAMNVNVEFSGTVVGRSVTSTYSAHPEREDSISILSMQHLLNKPVQDAPNPSRNLMGIFAGAPRPEDNPDPWIVIPKAQRGTPMPSMANTTGAGTIGRSATLRRASSRLSRTVDAMIDADQDRREEEDTLGALLERTSIHRGMSDSSIHSTFLSHGGERDQQGSPRREAFGDPSTPQDRNSVLQALSRRMQTFRFGGMPPASDSQATVTDAAGPSPPDTPMGARQVDEGGRATPTGVRMASPRPVGVVRAASPASRGLFQSVNLSSWATAALDPSADDPTYMAGSPREEFMHRPWGRERETERMI